MKQGDLIDELVVGRAKSCRQGFSFTLGSSRFERLKRLEQFVGFHLITRFSRVEADRFETRLSFGGARLGTRQGETQDCGLAADGDRNHDDTNGRETQVLALVSRIARFPTA